MGYLEFVITLFAINAVLALSLNLLVGYSGVLSLSHAAFLGLGAYGAALLVLRQDMPWLLAAVISIAGTSAIAFVFGVITLRLRDVYYVVGSFALQSIVFNVFLNWQELTGGALGLPGIPKPSFFGRQIEDGTSFMLFALAFLGSVLLICRRLVNSPYGRVLRAIREDETAATVLGKNVARAKTTTFVIACALAAAAGCILAPLLTFIDPGSFDIDEAIFYLALVIIGGSGNIWGSVLGAAVLTGVPELLTYKDVGGTHAPQINIILYGVVLVLFIRLRPMGLLPEGWRWDWVRFRRPGASAEGAAR
jgi:branched-chain amino acid transport system permease protein